MRPRRNLISLITTNYLLQIGFCQFRKSIIKINSTTDHYTVKVAIILIISKLYPLLRSSQLRTHDEVFRANWNKQLIVTEWTIGLVLDDGWAGQATQRLTVKQSARLEEKQIQLIQNIALCHWKLLPSVCLRCWNWGCSMCCCLKRMLHTERVVNTNIDSLYEKSKRLHESIFSTKILILGVRGMNSCNCLVCCSLLQYHLHRFRFHVEGKYFDVPTHLHPNYAVFISRA